MCSNSSKPRDWWKRTRLVRSIRPSSAVGVREIIRMGGSILASWLMRTRSHLVLPILAILLSSMVFWGCSKDEVPTHIKALAEKTTGWSGDLAAELDALSKTELQILYQYIKNPKYRAQVLSENSNAGVRSYLYWTGRISVILGDYDFDEVLTGVVELDADASGSGMDCYRIRVQDRQVLYTCVGGYVRSILDRGRFKLYVKYDESGDFWITNAEKLE